MPKGRLIPLDIASPPEIPQSITKSSPEHTFHYAWVSDLLENVLDQVERNCQEDDKDIHWDVFNDRVLQPIMSRSKPPGLKEITAKYGIQDETKVSNMIVTVRRRLLSALKQRLRESVTSDEYVNCELEQIRQFFPKIAQDFK